MKTKCVDLYTFAELNPDAQNKAIEINREINIDHEWYEFTLMINRKRFKRFFEVGKMYFRGFSSQGDGAMFEYSDLTDKLKEAAINHLKNVTDCERKVLKSHLYIYGHGKQLGHYYHEKSCHHHLDMEWNNQTADQSDRHRNLEQLLNKVWPDIETFIENIYEKLAKHLCKQLQSCYDHIVSDEAVKEALIANECYFLESGENSPF